VLIVLSFVLHRVAVVPVVLFVVTLLIVVLMQFIPIENRAASYITNARQLGQIDRIIKEKKLDQPFLIQYGVWLSEAVRGNLGYSKASNEPVLETIGKRLPASVELAFYSGLLVIGVGIMIGTRAALHKGRTLDRISSFLAVVGFSLPGFVLGVWLLVIFYGALGIAPAPGRLSQDNEILLVTGAVKRFTGLLTFDALLSGQWSVLFDALAHLVLPVITLSLVSTATVLKAMRSSMLEVLGSDFIRTARAKGLSEVVVNTKHARRNALLPVSTLATATVLGLVGGSVIVETIFAYPGIGSWVAKSSSSYDYAGVLGFAVITAMVVIAANLFVDILYGILDPRVRL
jgi:ABC-type dipeptide/oligopeptide/nickel transport system permease component